MKSVENIIFDIKQGNFYSFTIKPIDEDEQIYTPGKRKNSRWLILAYCFMGTTSTDKLISRLEKRKNAEVIKIEDNYQKKIKYGE